MCQLVGFDVPIDHRIKVNESTGEIGKNTWKSTGELRRLAVFRILVIPSPNKHYDIFRLKTDHPIQARKPCISYHSRKSQAEGEEK